jgi:imidazolonepropionase-like amidohydrolase
MKKISGMLLGLLAATAVQAEVTTAPIAPTAIVLHAARLLDIESGRMVSPGEILVQGERIAAVGSSVNHPAGAQILHLGDTTLMPGLIDVHVHLFLHPGAED